jgi:hypothetical protein
MVHTLARAERVRWRVATDLPLHLRLAAFGLGCVACGSSAPSDAEVIGSKVRPPRPLARMSPGMARAEVEAALPRGAERVERGYRVASGATNVDLVVVMAPGGDQVAGLEAVIRDTDARALLTRGWGPAQGTDEWRDEATGWRAVLACAAPTVCTVAFTPHEPLAALFPGRELRPPGEHARLRFGMSPAEAAAVCAPCGTSADGARGTPLEVDGVWFAPLFIDDHLVGLHYELPPYAHAFLERRWGPSQWRSRDSPDLLSWVDPTTRWRATLQPPWPGRTTPTLVFVEVVPVVELIDRLLAIPLRVQTLAAFQEQHAALFWGPGADHSMTLPPIELEGPGGGSTNVMVGERDGKVAEIEVVFLEATLSPGGREAIHAALAQKWGPPDRGDAAPSYERFRYGKRITVTQDREHVGIALR